MLSTALGSCCGSSARGSGSRRAAPRAGGGQGGGGCAPRGSVGPAEPACPACTWLSHRPPQLFLLPSSLPAAEVPVSAQGKRCEEGMDKAEPSPELLRKKMRVSAGKVCKKNRKVNLLRS